MKIETARKSLIANKQHESQAENLTDGARLLFCLLQRFVYTRRDLLHDRKVFPI
jgi:hypothetical protein